jgi:Asp-tRNA(Asn)/Glu-tRNA(Gln) amidotransferase C subunit
MIKTLESQLHFVREIQSVDTTGVEPLQAIREESEEAKVDLTIGLESLKDALSRERVSGRMRRPRRQDEQSMKPEDKWDPLGTADKTVSGYFVVRSKEVAEE